MVLAVNRAVSSGARAVVCASTGNTSASAAAYAAAAGLPCHVILPAGKVARGKLAQALAAGARLVMVDGNFDAALEAVRRLGDGRRGGRRELDQPRSARGAADSRLRGRRRARARPRRRGAAGRQRREHHRLLGRLPPLRRGRADPRRRAPAHARLPGGGCRAHRARRAGRGAGDGRDGHPHRQPRLVGRRHHGARRVRRADRGRHRTRRSSTRSARSCEPRGSSASRHRRPASRACVACRPRDASVGRRRWCASLTGHGLKDPDSVQAEEGSLTPIAADLESIRREMQL